MSSERKRPGGHHHHHLLCYMPRRHWCILFFLVMSLSVLHILLLTMVFVPPHIQFTSILLGNTSSSLQLSLHQQPRAFLPGPFPAEKEPKREEKSRTTRAVSCSIPKLDPSPDSIKVFTSVPSVINSTVLCKGSAKYPVLFVADSSYSMLRRVALPEQHGYTDCCYKQLVNPGMDDEEYFSPTCWNITEEVTVVPDDVEFIRVVCKKLAERSKWETVDMFAFTPFPAKLRARIEKSLTPQRQRKGWNERERPSVVILALDSVSHMNFQRILPNTFKFLTEELQALGFNGYTKIGERTLHNIVAALMGLTTEELEEQYLSGLNRENGTTEPNSTLYFDKAPFIWKSFKEQGYATSFVEDAASMGVFNWQFNGFQSPPVDFYPRPLFRQIARVMGHKAYIRVNQCYGNRLPIQVLLEYMRSLASVMSERDVSYFQLLWSNALFHDSLTNGKVADPLILSILKWFLHTGKLDKTVLILMSDHGFRFGSMRDTIQGKIEDRMPFLYMVLPPWLYRKYPLAILNMKRNAERLTTAFDLYETLWDFLNLTRLHPEELFARMRESAKKGLGEGGSKIARGISLFLPVPDKRTCSNAGIDQRWCTCASIKAVDFVSSKVYDAVQVGIDLINSLLSEKQARKCSKLKLHHVTTVAEIEYDFESSVSKAYSVTFLTVPGFGRFEGEFVQEPSTLNWTVEGSLVRINSYKAQSYCVKQNKQYCYCT